MTMFSHWDDDEYDDASMFSHWLEDIPDGHPKSAYKDDGGMKLFKDEDD